jgi:NAD(P)H dehydrogenase (quinone)
MTEQVKLAVIYYSSTGTIDGMARRAASAGEKAGAEVRLRQVAELAPR